MLIERMCGVYWFKIKYFFKQFSKCMANIHEIQKKTTEFKKNKLKERKNDGVEA